MSSITSFFFLSGYFSLICFSISDNKLLLFSNKYLSIELFKFSDKLLDLSCEKNFKNFFFSSNVPDFKTSFYS